MALLYHLLHCFCHHDLNRQHLLYVSGSTQAKADLGTGSVRSQAESGSLYRYDDFHGIMLLHPFRLLLSSAALIDAGNDRCRGCDGFDCDACIYTNRKIR